MEPNENPRQEGGFSRSRLNSSIVAASVAFGLMLAGLGVAAAQSDSGEVTTTTTHATGEAPATTASTPTTEASPGQEETPSTTVPGPSQERPHRSERSAETELTGDVAGKVRGAALAAVPGGTVIRAETDSDGSPYEAHVRKADGREVVVKVDESFEVTSVEADHMGHKGPGHGPGRTPLAADVAERVEAAAMAAVPGGTFLRAEGPRGDAAYHAHVRKADGTEVVVTLDEDFKVTGTQEFPGGFGHGGRHGGPRPGDTDPQTETG